MGKGDGGDKQAAVVAALLETAKTQAGQIKLLMEMHLARQAAPVAVAAVAAPTPHASLTWAELWTHYSEVERGKLASWTTVEGRAKHVIRILGHLRVAESTMHTIRHYREVRKTEITIRKKVTTATTRNREIELILRMARWGSRQKPPIVQVNPFYGHERDDLFEAVENVRLNVVEDVPGPALSLEELLAGADLFEKAMVLVAHSSGMRRREIALLERAWIDLRPDLTGEPLRIIEIPPGISKGRRGKKRGRQTFISREALEAIDEYAAALPDLIRRRTPYVFANPKTGDHYEPGHFTVRFHELQQRRGMVGPSGPIWLHDCRRSFITLARRRGEDTSNIMQASGHKTLSAFKRYDIHSRQDAIIVRDRMEAAKSAELLGLRAADRRGPSGSKTEEQSGAKGAKKTGQ